MEQGNSKTSENTTSHAPENPVEDAGTQSDVTPSQQHSLPDGGDLSSGQGVGGSKVDPLSTGPNVEGTIAGRN